MDNPITKLKQIISTQKENTRAVKNSISRSQAVIEAAKKAAQEAVKK